MFNSISDGDSGSQSELDYPGAFSSAENLQYLYECLTGSTHNSTRSTCNLDDNGGLKSSSFVLPNYQAKPTSNGKSKKRQIVKRQCTYCAKEFSSRNLASHIRTHQKVQDIHRCGLCFREYLRNPDLNQHKKDHHQLKFGTIEFMNSQKIDKHICGICAKEFPDVERLVLHRRKH